MSAVVTDVLPVEARPRSWTTWLAGCFLAERERWPLWLPVCLGTGIGIYFHLRAEPPLWAGLGAVGLSLAGLLLLRRSNAGALIMIGLLSGALGFSAAELRTRLVAAPVLEARMGTTPVEGRVRGIDQTAGGHRVVLDRLQVRGLPPDQTPARIRLSIRGGDPALVPGQRVRVRALLRPAMPPSAPGGFDFQRFLYFAGIGGIGNAFGPFEQLPTSPGEVPDAAIWIAQLRATITARVLAVLPGDVGAVAAALIAGDESKISTPINQAMRDSGLAHLLSISGLHIAIVAGLVFFVIRGGLALCPPIALRFPIKKWAALGALAAAGAYAVLAGWTVPTQRSFLMSALVLLALLIDRSALSLRVVAWSAVVVLACAPEALLNPSFQMSYAAVIALIAGYEVIQPSLTRWRARGGWWRFPLLYLFGLVFSSLLATLATAPFSAFTFNRIALFGLVANMIAVPLSGVLVMPAGLVGILLMPFGWEAVGLIPMGWGVAIINRVAVEIAGWPAAVIHVPAFPIEALAVMTFGALWLCLWRHSWRWWGLAVVAAGCLAALLARSPELLISPDGKLMAVNPGSGHVMMSGLKGQRFTAESWLARYAEEQPVDLALTTASGAAAGTADAGLRCDALGCLYRTGRHIVALVLDPRALADDCRTATLVISAVPVRGRCPSAERVIDRFDLWRAGAHALWLSDAGVTVQSVRDYRGIRPWAPAPEDHRKRQASVGSDPSVGRR